MAPTVTDAGPFEKLLTIAVAESDLDGAKEQAARKLAKDIKIKGFRPGKAPVRVVEATVGPDRLRSEALDHALPELVAGALRDSDLVPAVTPTVQDVRDDDGALEVDVRVTLWPRLEDIPTYDGREIEVEDFDVEEPELEEQVDRMREQFAELETVTRPAMSGDFVSVNLTTTEHGVMLDDASAEDLLYELGTGSFIEGMDSELAGAAAGQIIKYNAELPPNFGDLAGKEVTVQFLVKEVQRRKLPELTDEWASDVTEFETVDELRAELRERLLSMKRGNAANAFQVSLLETMLDEMELEMPDDLVRAEMDSTLHRFAHQLEGQGVSLEDYLRVTGQEEAAFVGDLRLQADRSVRTDVLLDAIASERDLAVDDGEYSAALDSLATQTEESAQDIGARIAGSAQEMMLRSDILRRKALRELLESAVPVDPEGSPIDLWETEPAEADEPSNTGEANTGEADTGEANTGEEEADARGDLSGPEDLTDSSDLSNTEEE